MKVETTFRNGFEYRLGDGSSSFWYAPSTKIGKLFEHVLYADILDFHLTIANVNQDDIIGCWVFYIPNFLLL